MPYMAPEQQRADGKVGPEADIYALGVLWSETLAGGESVGLDPNWRDSVHRESHSAAEKLPQPRSRRAPAPLASAWSGWAGWKASVPRRRLQLQRPLQSPLNQKSPKLQASKRSSRPSGDCSPSGSSGWDDSSGRSAKEGFPCQRVGRSVPVRAFGLVCLLVLLAAANPALAAERERQNASSRRNVAPRLRAADAGSRIFVFGVPGLSDAGALRGTGNFSGSPSWPGFWNARRLAVVVLALVSGGIAGGGANRE
jgi:hypothetical protein